MRARILAALMAVLLFAWPAAAQEQRGSIEGTVKDTSGAILPGVTVEAKSAAGNVIESRRQTRPGSSGSRLWRRDSTKSPRTSRALHRRSSVTFRSALARSSGSSSGCRWPALPKRCRSRRNRRSSTSGTTRVRSTSAPSRSICSRTAVTSRRSSRRRPAPTRSRSSVASRSTAPAPARTATSSTVSRRPTSRAAPRARASSPTSSKKSR